MKNAGNSVLYKNTAMLYIMTATKYILPLAITACLTRNLGKDTYGVVIYLTAVMNYFLLIFEFGFNYSATRDIVQHKNDKEKVESILKSVFTAKILLSILGLAVLTVIIFFIPILKHNILLTYLFYISTVINIFLPDFLYRGLEQMSGITIRYVIAKAITAVLTVLMIHKPSDIYLVPILSGAGTLIAVVYTLIDIRRRFGYKYGLTKIGNALKSLKASTIYFASTFATTAFSATNTLVMGIAGLPEAELAYWGVAFQVIQTIQALYDPLTTSIYPHVVANKNYKTVLKITSIITPVIIAGSVLTYLLADVAIKIIAGADYLAATPILRLLVPILLLSFWAQMIGFPLLGAMGEQKKVTLSTVISAVFHVVGLVLLLLVGSFNLTSVSVLRNITEFVLFFIRLLFVIQMIRCLKRSERQQMPN